MNKMIISSSFSKEYLKKLLFEYASDIIDDTYLSNIIEDDDMTCVYHNMNSDFTTVDEISSFIFYKDTTELIHIPQVTVILLIVHPSLRSNGYGNLAMMEFFDYIKSSQLGLTQIVLHAMNEKNWKFYKNLGFRCIQPTKFLKEYEDFEENDNSKRCYGINV
tara:strand:- start:977 stop:1462 length:486 start_codon:yes stop_codon:yes gene_type:complete